MAGRLPDVAEGHPAATFDSPQKDLLRGDTSDPAAKVLVSGSRSSCVEVSALSGDEQGMIRGDTSTNPLDIGLLVQGMLDQFLKGVAMTIFGELSRCPRSTRICVEHYFS